jgi:uncharacterized protein YggE
VISILNANGLTPANYQSNSFSVYPNTSYVNGNSQVIGQIASQSFQITIPNISANGSNIGKLIDSLAAVNGIVVNGLSFALSNQTSANTQARQLAFQNAQSKAQDYAGALQLSLGLLVNVVDTYSTPAVVTNGPMVMAMAMAKSPVSTPTTVNVGTIGVSYSL